MLCLTRLNGTSIVLNADLIESIEATPDTVVVLVTQRKIVVRESPDAIIDKIIAFRRRCQFGDSPSSAHVRPSIIALHETKRLSSGQKRSSSQDEDEEANISRLAYRFNSLTEDEEERS